MSLENRKKCEVGDVENVLSSLRHKLMYRVQQYGDHGYASVHEILGLITEEYKELIDAVQEDKSEDKHKIYGELIDIAVGCVWACMSIGQKTIDW